MPSQYYICISHCLLHGCGRRGTRLTEQINQPLPCTHIVQVFTHPCTYFDPKMIAEPLSKGNLFLLSFRFTYKPSAPSERVLDLEGPVQLARYTFCTAVACYIPEKDIDMSL